MKRKNTTRNALVTSIISMLLCVSMLVGTTFAWFTDEVVTGMNTIAAGNLDVELLADGNKVDSNTKLFNLVDAQGNNTWWEPGMVVYENLQVANVGTLALKYQMSLNFGNENDLNGHKLSEVLKVVVLDEAIDANMTRVQVLEKAKAAAEEKIEGTQTVGYGALSNFYITGELEAKTESEEFAVVIYWAPNDNDVDNLYNANNGQVTSDGAPLHIEFGVNLQATQKMSEEDSFGKDYDEFASILPKATVNNLGATKVTATTSFPNGTDAKDYDLDVAFQFLPNETYEEAQSNGYRYWHADYVIKADKAVPANSMALAGYYAAFCEDYNDDNWVLLSSPDVIPANTEIRLVEKLGGGSISVNYEEICNYGNDGVGFQCGAVDLTGANIGTTITVELRLYETTKAPDATSGTANEEVLDENGKPVYEVVGKYTYTFGAFEVKTAEELKSAVNNGVTEIKLGTDIDMGSEKLTVAKDVTLDLNGNALSGTCNAGQGHLIMVNNGAALSIKDSSSAKTGKITYAQGSSNTGWAIDLEGELNLYSGTIELTGDSWSIGYCVDVRPNAWGTNYTEDTVFHMYGGKLVSSDGAIRVASSSSDSYTNIVASFIMDGGEIDAAWDGIFVQQSNAAYDTLNVTINNGSVTSKLSPIRVYAPVATSVNAGTEKPMTITVNGGYLLMNGTPDESRVWHTLGKLVIGGGITLDDLNQYATITLN